MTDKTDLYLRAEAAYVTFFLATIEKYKDRIQPHIYQQVNNVEYAKATFHDEAFMVAIIEDIVKGRRFE